MGEEIAKASKVPIETVSVAERTGSKRIPMIDNVTSSCRATLWVAEYGFDFSFK